VSSVGPTSGLASSGALLDIRGANFPPPDQLPLLCSVGGSTTAATWISPGALQCRVPPQASGADAAAPISLVLNGGAPSQVATFAYVQALPGSGPQFGGIAGLATGASWATLLGGAACAAAGVVLFMRRRPAGKPGALAEPPSLLDSHSTYGHGGGSAADSDGDAADGALAEGQAQLKCLRGAAFAAALALGGVVLTAGGISGVVLMRSAAGAIEDGSAPSMVELVAANPTALSLRFAAPPAPAPPMVSYELQMTTDQSVTYLAVYAGSEAAYDMQALLPSTAYGFRGRYVVNGLPTAWGATVSYSTLAATAPLAPAGLYPFATSVDSLSFAWDPAPPQGSAVTSYAVEQRESRLGKLQQAVRRYTMAPEARTHVAEGLTTDTLYSFTVTAVSAAGTGPPSVPFELSTNTADAAAPLVSTPPTVQSATPTTLTVLLGTSSSPSNNAAVLGNQLEALGDSGDYVLLYSGLEPVVVVQQLAASTTYEMRCRAINSIGAGDVSPIAPLLTADPSVPGQVSGLVQTAIYVDRALLRWSVPVSEGAPVLRYELQIGPEAAGVTLTAETNELLIPDLPPNAVTAVLVRAVNSVGASLPSLQRLVYTSNPAGQCTNPTDAETFNKGLPTFQDDLGACCAPCLGGQACFSNCFRDLHPYGAPCMECFAANCQCSGIQCLGQCIGGPSPGCDACVIEKCSGPFEECSGIPEAFEPGG